MKIVIENDASEADKKVIRDGLEQYNRQFAMASTWQPFNAFVRNEDDKIIGGMLGGSFWRWFYIEIFWLDDSIRNAGYGSQMLELAEKEAKTRDCVAIFVDTMSFQAPKFYKKKGYTEWGRLDDFPPGHARIFMQKQL